MRLPHGINGLLHKSEIAHKLIANINDQLQIGQQIQVKVIETDDSGRVRLSMKELDSFKLKLGKVYEGKVEEILDYGALVNLLPGIDGMLHISKITGKWVENINGHLQIGQLIKVKVIEIRDDGRVELSPEPLDSSEPKPVKKQAEPAAQPEQPELG